MIRMVLTLLLLTLTSSIIRAEGPVKVAVLTNENWDEMVPKGKEVDAILGDIVIRNDYLIAVIAQPKATRHANMTVKNVGGCLIDLTSTEHESDQLSCYYPHRREFTFTEWQAIDSEGEQIPLDGTIVETKQVMLQVKPVWNEEQLNVVVSYALREDFRSLQVISHFTNFTKKTETAPTTDDIRADGGKEEMRKSPNATADSCWIDDTYWQQAYLVFCDGWNIQANHDSRTSTLKYLHANGKDGVVIPPNGNLVLRRNISAGRSLLHAKNHRDTQNQLQNTLVTLKVRDASGAAIPHCRVAIDDAIVWSDANGIAEFPIAPGEYKVDVSLNGAPVLERYQLEVEETEMQSEIVELIEFQPGHVAAQITNADGRPIPVKVEILPVGETPRPDFGPETADFGVKNLQYTVDGTFDIALHPGEYDCLVSHGPEYEVATVRVTVEPGKTAELTAALHHSVDTKGWISADYHSHSSPSGDNTGSQLGRVINLVCEHVEFGPCTEHNRISTYADHIRTLKAERYMASCSGMELTGSPLPLNHQNVFPLIHHPREQDGGGPVTDGNPETQIARLALWDDRSEKFLQQNHPDIGWLFFDKNGDGEPDEGFANSFGFMDAMEIHPIDSAWNLTNDKPTAPSGNSDREDRILHWLQLQNLGYRIAGVVNTDAHYNFHGSGGLRNYVQSSTDNPAEIDILEMVHASEQGRLIMTNGPFLEVTSSARDASPVTAGEELATSTGKVTLHIRVQAPQHIAVDEVFILKNGKPDASLHWTREKHSDLFTNETIRFDLKVKVPLESDTHLVVVAGSRTATLGAAFGPGWGKQHPTAIANPIYVDTDGDGFTPNQDTLGVPLPVKGGTPSEDQ